MAVINEAFARRQFPGANPLGRVIMVGSEATNRQPVEIVGLVQDAAFTSVRDPIEPTLYLAFAQSAEPELIKSFPSCSLSIRSAGEGPPVRLSTSVAAAIGGIDSAATVSFQTMTETLTSITSVNVWPSSRDTSACSLFYWSVGVYGVTAHAVTAAGLKLACAWQSERAPHRSLACRRVTVLAGWAS